MRNHRRPGGNTLALTVAVLGIVGISIAVFILYYIQTFGAHKQTQTAIDAAALQAAKDIGEIYIDTNEGSYFGPVGVSDNLPPGDDLNKRPIVGINTLMATIRLDALIAEQLGSSTMLVLAREDYEKARATSFKLQQKILRACAGEVIKDRKGNAINIQANATTVYDANEVRLAKGKRFGAISLRPGILKSGQTLSSSGMPVPQPEGLAHLTGSQKYNNNGTTYYMAGDPINDHFANDGGNDWSFEFVPLSSQSTTLIDPNLWGDISSSDYLIPTLIKAEVDQEISPMASNFSEEEKKKMKPQRLHSSATALCASYGKLPPTDGSLKVSFPQTMPPTGYNIDFTSVHSIMTSGGSGGKTNQITLNKLTSDPSFQKVHTAKELGTDSVYLGVTGGGKGWNDLDHGIWVKAIGGAFPDEPGSSLSPPTHFHSRTEDNPSVVLSFEVYDWLKQMYTSANISHVVKALKTPLTSSAVATAMNKDGLIQPVYAEIDTKFPVTFALTNVPSTGVGDPRNLNNYAKDPEGYRRQFANVWGYVPADITLPASSLVVSIDNNKVVTTNGQSPETLTDLYTAVVNMNNFSAESMKVAQEVELKQLEEISRTEQFVVSNVDKTTGQPLSSTIVPALLEAARKHESAVLNYGRALVVMQNAKFGLQMSYALLNDRKMLSSFGATKVNDRTFELMPGHLYVPTRAATESEILGSGRISTGQDPAAGVCDWVAPPSDNEKEQLQFFVASKTPAIGHRGGNFDLLAPAFATSSIPPSDANIYSFALSSDGSISLKRQTKATAGVNVLEGQLQYQNTASLITDGGNNVKLKWNCVARNNVTNVDGAYFRNMSAAVTNIMPGFSDKPLACEWSLRCPAPEPECKKETIKIGSAQAGITAASFNLNNIKANTDAAGNIRFTFEQGNKKEELKFFESHEEWSAAWHKAWDKSIWSGNINGTNTRSVTLKGNLNPAALSQFYRASEGYITGNFAKEIMDNPDTTRGQQYFETFAKGMANLNVNDGYMKVINDKNAAQGITSSELSVLRALVYTSWVFYSKDENGCTTLYTFAS